ncbi:MAG: P-II family nitrogen regulator [Clostridia bacterium]|nr:P-II family nitrogen regulator [Clostridia bacterium]
MERKEEFELIVTIVNGGFSSQVVDSAKDAGAGGATLIKGRGTGIHETNNFLGVQIQPEKDIVIILTPKEDRTKIMQAICKSAGLDTEGQGLCFSLPVEDWSGICHLNNMVEKNSETEQNANEEKEENTAETSEEQ